MGRQLVARFLVDRPVRSGMVRAILDTLGAQGGAYASQLVRRVADQEPERITWSRPAGLLDHVGQEGSHTTFLRVAEGQPEPVLTFRISRSVRQQPSVVDLSLPQQAIAGSGDIDRVLGVCKGLYLFLESPWGTVRLHDAAAEEPSDERRATLQWANFLGPEIVMHVGPARLLTSLAFMVEILPDGGIMLVTHASPMLAATDEGRALRLRVEETTGVGEAIAATGTRRFMAADGDRAKADVHVRRRPGNPKS
jgi:hypothetical protein